VLYSGIDQHKLDSVITTYNASGERLRQRRLRNDRSAIVRYFAEFPGPHRAVVDTSGRWYWLRDLLVAHGVDLQLAHAKRLKAISTAKVKTDAIDSNTLAQLCQAGLIPLAHMIRPEFRGARDLLRTRLRLVSKRTSCRNSIHRLLEKFNVPTVAAGAAPPRRPLDVSRSPAMLSALRLFSHREVVQGGRTVRPCGLVRESYGRRNNDAAYCSTGCMSAGSTSPA
jgi:transposase